MWGGACAPGMMDGCAPAACAPTYGACAPTIGGSSVEAWGKPVYKKSWLFGKWKYAGMSDIKYVPRSFAAAPTVYAAPAHVDYCAPAPAHVDYCAPAPAHVDYCAPAHVDYCAPAHVDMCAPAHVDYGCAAPAFGGCY